MTRGIYLLNPDGRLIEMIEREYDSEGLLQGLLAEHPDLLAGGQINEESPRRWLLIAREAGLPDSDESGSRWSVDHLFLDQDAVPTIVEVKRSSDSRIRREVVGQMLDYAANAVVYWPMETIRALLTARAEVQGTDPDRLVQEFVDSNSSADEFWQAVKTNLQAGRVRLVFVSDVIPPELQRVVEFLNTQMDPAEVIAVEVKQFAGEGVRSLVPRVLGQTAEAQRKKSLSRRGRKWTEESFFERLGANSSSDEVRVARDLLTWAQETGLRIWWGEGAKEGSFYPMLDRTDGLQYTIAVRTSPKRPYLEVQFAKLTGPFDKPETRARLQSRLNEIEGVSIDDDAATRYPSIRLSVLTQANNLASFLAVLDWLVDESRE